MGNARPPKKHHAAVERKGQTLSAQKPTENDRHNTGGTPHDERMRVWLERDRANRDE
jgi:hypothetical protein